MMPTPRNPRLLVAHFHDRVEEGDILEAQHMVVPIKAGGLVYGAISKQFARQFPHITIPDLEFREASFHVLDEEAHRTVTFVAFWNDEVRYTPDHVAIAAGRAMMRFSLDSLKLVSKWKEPDPWLLSMPLFKGAEKSVDHVAAIQEELLDTDAALLARGLIPCEVEILVRDRERVPTYS